MVRTLDSGVLRAGPRPGSVASARTWVERYCDHARPVFAPTPDVDTLFLTVTDGRFAPDVLSRMVTAYVSAGAPAKHGSCHLFRHTAATLMLDAGADVRYVAEMLGHQKLETTMIYTRVSMAKLREVHAATHPAEQAPRNQPLHNQTCHTQAAQRYT